MAKKQNNPKVQKESITGVENTPVVDEKKAEQERIEAEKAEQERIEAEKAEQERVEAEKAEQERIEAEKEADKTYIMKVVHLSWGRNKRNHFYSEDKPVISRKLMGNYAFELENWLKAKWIEEGSYKK
jgi:hypothetical protein